MCVSCSQTDTTVYRTVLPFPLALCEINTIELKNTGARFYRQGDIHVKSVCLSEFPSLRYSTSRTTSRTTWTHTLFCLSSPSTLSRFLSSCILWVIYRFRKPNCFQACFCWWSIQAVDQKQSVSLVLVCGAGSNTGSSGTCLKGYCTKKGFAYQTLMTYRAKLKAL